MNCAIIEDEQNAVEHLEYQLRQTGADVSIVARIDSVAHAIQWLGQNKADLIFMDIQLGDGLSFEIFDHIQIDTPVIFTTSYNQYAIQAFEVNSISYLLKPVKVQNLKDALSKYERMNAKPVLLNDRIIPLNQTFQKRFLVQTGNVMHPLSVDEIAYFRIHEGKYIVITTLEKKQYLIDSTLEILEKRLDPERFYRINRQFIVSVDSIAAVHAIDGSKLKLDVNPESKDEMIISKEKASAFKGWLNR
jgi:DNA-binding LytR/AlgR family response regulator